MRQLLPFHRGVRVRALFGMIPTLHFKASVFRGSMTEFGRRVPPKSNHEAGAFADHGPFDAMREFNHLTHTQQITNHRQRILRVFRTRLPRPRVRRGQRHPDKISVH